MYLDLLLLSSVAPVVMITVLCARIILHYHHQCHRFRERERGKRRRENVFGAFLHYFLGHFKIQSILFFLSSWSFFVKERIEVLTRSISRPFGGRLKPIVTTPYPELHLHWNHSYYSPRMNWRLWPLPDVRPLLMHTCERIQTLFSCTPQVCEDT